MSDALGMIEVNGLVIAIEIADIMVKSANVELGDLARTKGVGWMTVKIFGDVSSVQHAIDTAKKIAISKDGYVSSKVIPRPVKGLLGNKDLQSETDISESIDREQNEAENECQDQQIDSEEETNNGLFLTANKNEGSKKKLKNKLRKLKFLGGNVDE